MSDLDRHVAPLAESWQMAETPALREAFKDSALTWNSIGELNRRGFSWNRPPEVPAPFVGEMLAVLRAWGWRMHDTWEVSAPSDGTTDDTRRLYPITDPAALARACIAAAKEGK